MIAEDVKPTDIKHGHARVDHPMTKVLPCSGRQRSASIKRSPR